MTIVPSLPVAGAWIGLVAAYLGPLAPVSFVLQLGGVGAAVGAALSLRARRHGRDVDAWQITTAWSTLGVLVGVAVVLVDLLV